MVRIFNQLFYNHNSTLPASSVSIFPLITVSLNCSKSLMALSVSIMPVLTVEHRPILKAYSEVIPLSWGLSARSFAATVARMLGRRSSRLVVQQQWWVLPLPVGEQEGFVSWGLSLRAISSIGKTPRLIRRHQATSKVPICVTGTNKDPGQPSTL